MAENSPLRQTLPAVIPGQNARFMGDGQTKVNFTMQGDSSPYNAQQAKVDAEAVQRARAAAEARRTAGGMNAGANQGSGAGVQGRVGPEPVARPGVVDLRSGNPVQSSGKGYEVARKAGSLLHESSAIRKAAPFVGKAALGADVVANFNDYKINDPSVDSSASGTFNALRQGDFAGAGRSLSKGLLETGMDLGSYAANTADILVPGQPFSQGYNKMLRNQFGDQLVDNSGNGPTAQVQPAKAPTAAPAATTPIVPANQRTRSLRDGGATPGETRGTFGDLSPVGTFAQGQTDLGGGIAGSGPLNSRGKFTEYTNIGVSGQPTALSQGDSRTPDQIANAARINAETAKFVAQRDRENRGSPGQQYIANMERMVGLPLGQIASKSLRNAIIAGAQQADKTGADNEAMLQKEGIASADRRLGHQVQLETAALPAKIQLQAAQQRRAAVGEALRAGGGDLRAASQVLNNAGYTDAGKELMEQYAAGQTSAKNDVEFNRNLTAASSVVKDDKGNDVISPARQAVNESALRQMVENYDQLSPQEKIAAEKQYRPALNILSGMNDRKDDTLFKQLGVDRSPTKTTLGNLEGAELGTVGFWEGLVTPGAERNDYVLRNGGRSQYINRDRISEAEEAFLASHGVNLRGVK